MLLIGSDFSFVKKAVRPHQKDAQTFLFLDSFISTLNIHSEKILGLKINAFYSTPIDYFKHLDTVISLPTLYNPDFSHYDERFKILHPSFEGPDRIDYWTGYYHNRPSLKSLIYRAFQNLHLATTFTNLAHFENTYLLGNHSTTFLSREDLSAQL